MFPTVGVDAHIDPQEMAVLWRFFRRIRGIVISRRRGGRLCPPAGIVCFYGDPMRIRNILTGRCGHRPLQPTSQNAEFEGRTESSAPTDGIEKTTRVVRKTPCFPLESCVLPGRCGHRPLHEVVFPIQYRRGRCPHRPAGNVRFMAVFRRIRGIVISRRRGGRPCPPAGIARFYGNPMRIRNILTGRCGHRPLRTTTEKRRI